MKKIMISAAIALFAVSAFAQTGSTSNEHATTVSSTSKETADLNKDGKLSREEKEAHKTARKAEAEARRADRADDGIINGSADNNAHGKEVSGIAKGTTLVGREKGKAVSDAARSKARNGEKAQRPESKKPSDVGRPSGTGRPSETGKPSGAGRSAGASRPSQR